MTVAITLEAPRVSRRRPLDLATAPPGAAGELQQLDGLVVVLSDGHPRSPRVLQYVGARLRQQLTVALAPFGQRRDCLERPVGVPMDVLGQVLGE